MEIKINYFKSIKDEIKINFDEYNIISLIGRNGMGKSNILDAIWHFKYASKNEIDIITNSSEENKDLLKISFKVKLNDLEILEIEKFLDDYKIKIDDFQPFKYFFKTYNEFNYDIGKNTLYYKILLEVSKFLLNKTKDYKDMNLLEKIEFHDNNNEEIYKLNPSKIKNLKNVKNELFYFFDDLNKKNENLKKIFYSYDSIDVNYCKNAESDNFIDYQYDFSLYESDMKTKIALDFFMEKPNETIEIIRNSSDGTKANEKKISNEKEKVKLYAKNKIKNIFENFDIYAEPIIDIDGNTFKIHVDSKEKYDIHDNISTQNNSSGYKSILWILLNLEQVIHSSKMNNKYIIYMLDEPDKNLHPLLQQQLIDYFIEKTKNTNVYIVFTTHSPFLLNDKIKSVFVERDSDGSTKLSMNDTNIISQYPKYLFDLLSNDEIFKHAYKKNILYVDTETDDDISEINQYIGERLKKCNIKIVSLKNVNINIIKSFQKLDNIIDIESIVNSNKMWLIPNDFIKKIRKKNDINN